MRPPSAQLTRARAFSKAAWKAVCHALNEVPAVNAEIDGSDIVYKNYCHIGVAVGTDKGLVVPVVRQADRLSLAGLASEIDDLATRARNKKLTADDLQLLLS